MAKTATMPMTFAMRKFMTSDLSGVKSIGLRPCPTRTGLGRCRASWYRSDRSVALPGSLRRDDDDPIGAAHAVDGDVSGVLQHFDRLDVVRVHARQHPAGAGLHRR